MLAVIKLHPISINYNSLGICGCAVLVLPCVLNCMLACAFSTQKGECHLFCASLWLGGEVERVSTRAEEGS